ncbi:hypothetical protein CWC19_16000 [Pseudoalteromonas aurantia]|uniref:Uncharacterized protein n=2 Tax=Pseudoalteromonas aurantia TaxID=43654 RepID=A0A5S3V6V1_9GAMM|nr:hypothetical protein CWC19_16000 [Pseudoalteromonas aurantia]
MLFLSSSAFALTLIIVSGGDIASSEYDEETLLVQSLFLFFFIWLAVKSTRLYENAKYSKRDQRLKHILKQGKKAGLSSAQIHHLLLRKLKKNKHKKATAGAVGTAIYHKHREYEEYEEYEDQYSKSTLNDLFQNETDENELCLILEDIKQYTEQEARTAYYEPSHNNRSSTSSSSARCSNAVDSEDDDNTENDQNDDE